MKRLIWILSLLVGLTSCSNDNEPSDTNSSELEGTWKLSAINLSEALDTNNDGQAQFNLVAENPIIEATLKFDDALNGSIHYNSWVSYSTEEDAGKLIFMVASSIGPDNIPMPFSYTKAGGSVMVEGDLTFNRINIGGSELLLDGNTLMMTVDHGFTAKDINTMDESVDQTVTYIFQKQ